MGDITRAAVATHPGFVSGNWYNLFTGGVQVGAAVGATTTRFVTFPLPRAMTVAALAARVTALDATGGVLFGLALYASDPVTKKPTGAAPLASVLGLSVAAVGVISGNLAANVTLPPGLYWAATSTSSASATFLVPANGGTVGGYFVGTPTLANIASSNTTIALNYNVTQAYGTWPDFTTAVLIEVAGTVAPVVFLKAA